MRPEIRIYTMPGCPHCAAAVQYFKTRNIATEIVTVDSFLVQVITKALKMDPLPVPIVSFLKLNSAVIGFKPDQYAHILNSSAGSGVSVEGTPVSVSPEQPATVS